MRDFSKFIRRFVDDELETLETSLLRISRRNLLLQNKVKNVICKKSTHAYVVYNILANIRFQYMNTVLLFLVQIVVLFAGTRQKHF